MANLNRTNLEKHFVKFHECHRLASAHVTTMPKAELHKSFHGQSIVFTRLGKPLGAEYVCIDAEMLL